MTTMRTLFAVGRCTSRVCDIFSDIARRRGWKFDRIAFDGDLWVDFDRLRNAAAFVAIWNGQQRNDSNIAAFCRRMAIPHVFVEQGFITQSDTLLFDSRGFNVESSLNDSIAWVGPEELARLHRERQRLQTVHPLKPEGHVLVPLQVQNDTQITYSSPFLTMDEFIASIATMYPAGKVIVREHPQSTSRRSSPARNVFIIRPEGPFLEEAAKASVVVGLNSTCLIEAGILGVPVVALADCPLRRHAPRDHDRVLAAYLARRRFHAEEIEALLIDMKLLPASPWPVDTI